MDDQQADHRRTRTSPPPALVVEGRYQFGTYDAPIPVINPLDAVTSTGWRAHVDRQVRNLRLKEWQAFQLGDDDWFILGAVYDTKVLGLLQLLVVDKAAATITRWEAKAPSPQLSVARGLDGTRSRGRSGGFSVSVTNEVSAGHITVDATHPGSARLPALELHGRGECGPDEATHLVICHPFSDTRALYSDKCMMPFSGTLRMGTDAVELGRDRSFLILDDHHGDYPAPMRYDWLTGVRRTEDGLVEGFNLTDNQVQDPDLYNENAIWRGNELVRLPAITIDRPDGPHGTWHAHDADGSVDVRFTPTVPNELHLGPDRSLTEYYGPFGWFEGAIDAEGTRLDVTGFFGMGEQKYIRI